MSRENVELVQKLLEVYNERSFGVNADLLDPDIVWDMSRVELPDAVAYTGPSEFRDFIEKWEEGFASEHMEAQEMVDAGDRVVAIIHHRGRGRISQIEVDQHFAMVWTLRSGRAVRMDLYPTRESALEAVGLSAG
jgi:ketosteroid isomerase-like protein